MRANLRSVWRPLLVSALPWLTVPVSFDAAVPAAATRSASESSYTSWLAQGQPGLAGIHSIQQESTSRFLDAHQTADKDFAVVTRPRQDNTTQRWILRSVGHDVYTIQQRGTGRFLDAHETADRDFAVVMRPPQTNPTQHWIVKSLGADTYTVQQVSNGRHLDAHETADRDFAVVTRERQDNTSQRWIIRRVVPDAGPTPPTAAGTCTIVGRVEGNLEARECLNPQCTSSRTHSLRQVSLATESPRVHVATSPLQGRNYTFQNVQPGRTYLVMATGGWQVALLGKPVQCASNLAHRLDIRLQGFSGEF